MKKTKLDKYEQDVEDTVSEYKTVDSSKRKRIQSIIKRANEKKNISLRVNSQDLDLLKILTKHCFPVLSISL